MSFSPIIQDKCWYSKREEEEEEEEEESTEVHSSRPRPKALFSL